MPFYLKSIIFKDNFLKTSNYHQTCGDRYEAFTTGETETFKALTEEIDQWDWDS